MVPISAKTGAGLDALRSAIAKRLDAGARRGMLLSSLSPIHPI